MISAAARDVLPNRPPLYVASTTDRSCDGVVLSFDGSQQEISEVLRSSLFRVSTARPQVGPVLLQYSHQSNLHSWYSIVWSRLVNRRISLETYSGAAQLPQNGLHNRPRTSLPPPPIDLSTNTPPARRLHPNNNADIPLPIPPHTQPSPPSHPPTPTKPHPQQCRRALTTTTPTHEPRSQGRSTRDIKGQVERRTREECPTASVCGLERHKSADGGGCE